MYSKFGNACIHACSKLNYPVESSLSFFRRVNNSHCCLRAGCYRATLPEAMPETRARNPTALLFLVQPRPTAAALHVQHDPLLAEKGYYHEFTLVLIVDKIKTSTVSISERRRALKITPNPLVNSGSPPDPAAHILLGSACATSFGALTPPAAAPQSLVSFVFRSRLPPPVRGCLRFASFLPCIFSILYAE